MGNCGKHNKSTDMIVALPTKDYAGGSHCEKVSICHVYGVSQSLICHARSQMIHITSGGKTHSAKVVDRCPDCSEGDLGKPIRTATHHAAAYAHSYSF